MLVGAAVVVARGEVVGAAVVVARGVVVTAVQNAECHPNRRSATRTPTGSKSQQDMPYTEVLVRAALAQCGMGTGSCALTQK